MMKLKIPLITVLLVALRGGTTSTCNYPSSITWECDGLPLLSVEFSGITITDCGSSYAKGLFENLIRVIYKDASFDEENKTYTVIMVDPDAPGSAAGQGWLHLIRSSIFGSDLASNGNSAGYNVTGYNKPTPPNRTGPHRYFIYLYEETGSSPSGEISKRAKFDIESFAADNNLCGPVAMNMFVTEY